MKKALVFIATALIGVAAMAQPKFAHVNLTELIQLMPEADDARAKLEASSLEAQETFQAMVEEYQAKYTTYSQKASTWTTAIRESKEKELMEIQQRIQDFDQSIQKELSEMQQMLMAPIQKKAMDTINALAKEGGYIYVFDKSTMLYLDEAQSTDLTPAARKALSIPEGRTLETLQQEMAARQQQQ